MMDMTYEEYDSHHKILKEQHEKYVIQNDQFNNDCLDNIFHKRFKLLKTPLSLGPVTIQPADIMGDHFK